MKPYLRNQLDKLRQEAQTKHQAHTSYKPLEQQLRELMLSTPPATLHRPWGMKEFVTKFTGKYRETPHAQNVAEALLKAGWQPKRLWGKDYLGKRYWLLNSGM